MSAESQIDVPSALCRLQNLVRLPWDVLSSVELADLLCVSLQVLANWRVRHKRPHPVAAGHFRGNRTYYRIDEVTAWLHSEEGRSVAPWQVVAQWLQQQFCTLPLPANEEGNVWAMAEQIDRLGAWPRPHRARWALSIRPITRAPLPSDALGEMVLKSESGPG